MDLSQEYSIEHTQLEETTALVSCINATATETDFHSFSKGEDGRPRFFLTPEEVAEDIKERRPQGRGVYLVAKVIW